MIVIRRRKDESLVINDDITVTVIEIRGDKVRLAIEAPRHMSVHSRDDNGPLSLSTVRLRFRLSNVILPRPTDSPFGDAAAK